MPATTQSRLLIKYYLFDYRSIRPNISPLTMPRLYSFFQWCRPRHAALLLISLFATANICPAQAGNPGALDLQAQVMDLFKMSCAECHDGSTARRGKGDFDTVLDPQAMIASNYFVIPGKPQKSEVYLLMAEKDPDMRMPPVDSDVHHPSEKEIAMVRDWIDSLASEPKAADAGDTPADKTASPAQGDQPKANKPLSREVLFARIHPLIVHFPVATIPMAAFIALLGGIFRRYEDWLPAIRWSLLIGALVAPVAVASGWLLADVEGFRDATVRIHRWLGVSGLVVAWICLLTVEWGERTSNPHGRRWAILLLLAAAVLIGFVGHTGGELVYGKGYPFN
ncbi:MAG: DUF2231 domain-containing protein [Puniceicoccales bacterium]